MFYLDVSKAGLVFGTIIDNSLTSVNQIVIPHFLKCVVYGVDDFIVQSECQMLPWRTNT